MSPAVSATLPAAYAAPLPATPLHRAASQGRWIEAVSHLDPVYGGLCAAVPQMASELSLHEGFTIDVASFTKLDESSHLAERSELSVTHWPSSRLAWMRDRALRERLMRLIADADGVHVHGLWEAHGSLSASVARELGKPYIVSAHGMLDPWALASKRWKKRLYAAVVERATLQGAACLHALTRAEARDYRSFGCSGPIAIIPNGVTLRPRTDDQALYAAFPQLHGKRLVLFMGRLHYKKGLDLLVDAWAALAHRFSDATLVLAGPDSDDSRAPIERRVRESVLGASVVFTGMLSARMKHSALANAECFVLPSYSEGHSVAVLEAMGAGLPVILSTECHVPEVTAFHAGWEIPAELDPLVAALEAMLLRTPAENAATGSRARDLVRQRFTTEVVTRQMAELYRWVQNSRLQGGPRPTTFELLEAEA